ncbi:MAG: asparagine synthase (glutamine-hydrolyzing) [Thermoflavifilum sp.]|nr:asparagine synthase (glutamine-hydrolyzing) [Thermoflavifilum sp.]
MCGIAGYCDFTFHSSIHHLKEMTDALIHRGPDDQGYEIFDNTFANIGLGHRRLSIIDLTPGGHQPMSFEHLTIVYNGEVYNFMSIRDELVRKGYQFNSQSDTEVLLKGFHCWGTKVVDYCIGMFAFIVLDHKDQKLYAIRDRAGVKPLYYFWNGELFLFASELKSFYTHSLFPKQIDPNALALFLQYSYIPAPYTIFKDTFKLLPGHILCLDLVKKSIEKHRYWDVSACYRQPLFEGYEQEVIDRTEALMLSAYQYRMVADVPVGIFLSGGYDSTSVAALLQTHSSNRLKTFTIGFHEADYNEAKEAKAIAEYLGTDHHEWYVVPDDAVQILHNIPEVYDEPFADNSVVPTILVSQFAAREVKVVLSADGGDEIFAGYRKFNQALHYTQDFPRWLQRVFSHSMQLLDPEFIPFFNRQYNFSTRYEKMKRIWEKSQPAEAIKWISQYITENEIDQLLSVHTVRYNTLFDLNGSSTMNDPLNALLNIDYQTFLVDNNLVKVDRATMSVSIEGREPMLDHRLIEWLSRLPAQWKINNGVNKYLLKQIVHKYVPKELMDRPKNPFIAPLTVWFKNELSHLLSVYLSEDQLRNSGFFNVNEVIRLRDAYLSGKKISYQKIWNILVFQLWYNKWMV